MCAGPGSKLERDYVKALYCLPDNLTYMQSMQNACKMQNAGLDEEQAGFSIFCHACGNLVPQPGIKPGPSAMREQSPNHWTTKEFPEEQAGIKIAKRNISTLRYADDTTIRAESEEELNSLLTRVKEGSEKPGLKLNIQKTKIMASGPITSWQIEGEKVETVTDFNFLGSKLTVDGDCSYEIKRHLLLGRKAMTNLNSVLRRRSICCRKGDPSRVRELALV